MSNLDVNELIVWVQKTVGGGINHMNACPNSGVIDMDVPGFREKIYLQTTEFLVSDTPLNIDIKKECVVQCVKRLESAANLRSKASETRALSGNHPSWNGLDSAAKLIKSFFEKNGFKKMLENEAEQLSASVRHITSLSDKPFKDKIKNSRTTSVKPEATTKNMKA